VHTPARVAGVLILAAATLAGCATATPGPASPETGTPQATTSATPSAVAPPTAGGSAEPTAGGSAAGVTLPWPAAGATKVSALQSAVDGGAQPWLLDPTDVALSYATARGWTSAEATANGTSDVTVRSSAGTHALTLAQPGRTGNTGIWVVTSDSSR
jgi:hypothetical protein